MSSLKTTINCSQQRLQHVVQRARLLITVLIAVEDSQVVEGGGELRMVGSQRLFRDRQGPLIQRSRPLVTALIAVPLRRIVKGRNSSAAAASSIPPLRGGRRYGAAYPGLTPRR